MFFRKITHLKGVKEVNKDLESMTKRELYNLLDSEVDLCSGAFLTKFPVKGGFKYQLSKKGLVDLVRKIKDMKGE